jgi:hypothetical protein
MLADQPDGARLWSLLAHFFEEGDRDAGSKSHKSAAEHAVAMKIDLAAIGALEEPEMAARIECAHDPDGFRRMRLDLALQPPNPSSSPRRARRKALLIANCRSLRRLSWLVLRPTLTALPPGSSSLILTS